MKTLLLISILGLVCISSSCRTSTPLDPDTLKPSDRCLPGNYHLSPGKIQATK